MDWVTIALQDPECASAAVRDDHHERLMQALAHYEAHYIGARYELGRAVRGYLCYLATAVARGWLPRHEVEENIEAWMPLYGFTHPLDPFLGIEAAPLYAEPVAAQPTWQEALAPTRRTPWSSPAYAAPFNSRR